MNIPVLFVSGVFLLLPVGFLDFQLDVEVLPVAPFALLCVGVHTFAQPVLDIHVVIFVGFLGDVANSHDTVPRFQLIVRCGVLGGPFGGNDVISFSVVNLGCLCCLSLSKLPAKSSTIRVSLSKLSLFRYPIFVKLYI